MHMKRFCILLLLLTTLCPLFANKISVDVVKDGWRYVQTERTPHIFAVWKTLTDGGIALWCAQNEDFKEVKQYSIVIYYYFDTDIEEDSRLLLKMRDGSIIELKCRAHSTTMRLGLAAITFAEYLVSEEQLQEIMNNNVVKIRVETEFSNNDSKVYGKMFSKTIAKDYKLIEDTLTKEVLKEETFYDNF